MRAIVIALVASVALIPAANAKDGRSTAITIYSGLALVEDTRNIDFPPGRAVIQFPDVSAQIRPDAGLP